MKKVDKINKLLKANSELKKENMELSNNNYLLSEDIRGLKGDIQDLKVELRCTISDSNASKKAFDKMEEHYNNHMDIAENEIKRLNQIIFYLETKCMKGFE